MDTRKKNLILIADGIFIVLMVVIAIVYWTHEANQLPHWFPGYSSTGSKTVHFKHGLAAVIVALAAAAYGWFISGPKPTDSTPNKEQ